jgi:hypothetical protein
MKIFDIIAKKLNKKSTKDSSVMTNPVNMEVAENEFLNRMSKHALNLYEKQCDIKKFSKLVLSNPENTSHNEMVEALLKENVLDPLSDEVIKELANNDALLDDLGL